MTAVKICGITRVDDGLAALEAGADALGFVLADHSPRQLAPRAAVELVTRVRKGAPRPFLAVAVLGSYGADDARNALAKQGFDLVQLVGPDAEPVAALERALEALGGLSDCVWGSIRVRDAASLAGADKLACDAVHLDAHAAHALGGTGHTFDWALAAGLARAKRVVLAGGLTSANVADAVQKVRPWRVDVSSGVEASPGIKDRDKMKAFVEAVQNAEV
jgi:phosphoribosylanthranilate isomerase